MRRRLLLRPNEHAKSCECFVIYAVLQCQAAHVLIKGELQTNLQVGGSQHCDGVANPRMSNPSFESNRLFI